jgi:hypothetical protein
MANTIVLVRSGSEDNSQEFQLPIDRTAFPWSNAFNGC